MREGAANGNPGLAFRFGFTSGSGVGLTVNSVRGAGDENSRLLKSERTALKAERRTQNAVLRLALSYLSFHEGVCVRV